MAVPTRQDGVAPVKSLVSQAWNFQCRDGRCTWDGWITPPPSVPPHLQQLSRLCAYGALCSFGSTKMYFAVNEYGVLWYVVSWAVMFVWVEFFAYAFHRFFHLRCVEPSSHLSAHVINAAICTDSFMQHFINSTTNSSPQLPSPP